MNAPWGELAKLCSDLHRLLYIDRNRTEAIGHVSTLRAMLQQLPDEIDAIVHAEALAIYYELLGDKSEAIAFRELEITLMKALHAEVKAQAHEPEIATAVLKGRGTSDLDTRYDIIRTLR